MEHKEPPRSDVGGIRFQWPTDRQRLMKSRGVDGYAFSLARSPFQAEDAFVRIRPQKIEWLPEEFDVKSISIRKQIGWLNGLLARPFKGNGIVCIGSYPSDTRAKVIAANIFSNAIDHQMQGKMRGKAYPLWHRLYGGYSDSLRDLKERDPCSMLVLSNVGADSTQAKLEKLRDLLEIYDDIPKIVIVNGVDPVTFFADKVRLPLRGALYIDSGHRPTGGSILDI